MDRQPSPCTTALPSPAQNTTTGEMTGGGEKRWGEEENRGEDRWKVQTGDGEGQCWRKSSRTIEKVKDREGMKGNEGEERRKRRLSSQRRLHKC